MVVAGGQASFAALSCTKAVLGLLVMALGGLYRARFSMLEGLLFPSIGFQA